MLVNQKVVAPLAVGATFDAVKALEEQIKKGVKDYFTPIDKPDAVFCNVDMCDADNFTDVFYRNFAQEAYFAKSALREMMRKSPAWNENLQVWVINGNRTHEPNKKFITEMAQKLLKPAIDAEIIHDVDGGFISRTDKGYTIFTAIRYFTNPGEKAYQNAVKEIAPKANLRQKKSKVFMALCKALKIPTENREFQMDFSDLCNEFNAKKISFKLYVSINPIHFLTMSNPKYEEVWNEKKLKHEQKYATLVSCHSLNSDYSYKNGCMGYALDGVSMIAFTVSDDNDPATFNNRKTTRQIFAYKDGVLLQSRLYTSFRESDYGGVDGDEGKETVRLYRELIQREIAECEGVPNFWGKPIKYCDSAIRITKGDGFSGYADWLHFDNQATISIRKDCEDTAKGFAVGSHALCIECGEQHSGDTEYLTCPNCRGNERCDECGNEYDLDDMHDVINQHGDNIRVCQGCLDNEYFYCEECGEYHHNSRCIYIEHHGYICRDCYENSEKFFYCGDCERYYLSDESYWVGGVYGYYVCGDCFENDYEYCEHCESYHRYCDMYDAHDENGNEIRVCSDYLGDFTICDECGEYYPNEVIEENGGICSNCAQKNNVA